MRSDLVPSGKEYLADLTGGGLLLAESRPVARLLRGAPSEEAWYHRLWTPLDEHNRCN